MGNALSFFKSQREEKITPEVEARIANHVSKLFDVNGKAISGMDLSLEPEADADYVSAWEKAKKKWGTPVEGGNSTKG